MNAWRDEYKRAQAQHDCGDPLCQGLPDIPVTLNAIADRIDARQAQLAVARAMVTMGSEPEWDSETIEHVARPMKALAKSAGLPTFTSIDAEATEFWQSVRT